MTNDLRFRMMEEEEAMEDMMWCEVVGSFEGAFSCEQAFEVLQGLKQYDPFSGFGVKGMKEWLDFNVKAGRLRKYLSSKKYEIVD